MGSILSKRTKKDKEKLQEDFDIGEQNDQIQIVPLQNKSVIHENHKEIVLSVPNGNGVRHDELQDAKSRESPEITKLKKEIHEIRNLLAQNTKENALLSKEIENLKSERVSDVDRDTRDTEAELEEKLREERYRVQDVISEQINIKFKDQDSSVNKLVETSKAEIIQEVTQLQTAHAYDEVDSLKELIRILSVSTVIKNTAHLNYPPTEAMETIEIKISFAGGTEKKTPRMINVQNLMRITTVHELKYHLAEKYKHLKVGELIIKWKGIELADAATLLEYGICNKDQIDLEVRAIVTYVIQIQLNKDSKLPVEVTPATKIRYIKEWIHDQTSITVEKQILRHGDNLLNDDKRMAECQIGEGEIIRLEICHTGSFPVYIMNHTGVKCQVEVESRDSIETLKLQVSNKIHAHVNQFELFIKNTPADPSKKLYEYSVESGEIIQLKTTASPATFPNSNFTY